MRSHRFDGVNDPLRDRIAYCPRGLSRPLYQTGLLVEPRAGQLSSTLASLVLPGSILHSLRDCYREDNYQGVQVTTAQRIEHPRGHARRVDG